MNLLELRDMAKAELEIKLQELKEKLQKAIQKEEFEEAAKLRDKVREIEKKNNKEHI